MQTLFHKLGGNKVHQSIRSNRYEQSSNPCETHEMPDLLALDLVPAHTPDASAHLDVKAIVKACCILKFPEASLLYGQSLDKCVEGYKRYLVDWPDRTPKTTKTAVTKVLSARDAVEHADINTFLKHVAHLHKVNVFICADPFHKGVYDASPQTTCHLVCPTDTVQATLENAKAYLIENQHYDADTLEKMFSASELKEVAINLKLDCKKIKRDIIFALMQGKKN